MLLELYIPHASELLLIDELESLFWTSFVEWMIEYCPSDPGHGAKSIYTMGSNIFCVSIIVFTFLQDDLNIESLIEEKNFKI